jgi:hypothetical protein
MAGLDLDPWQQFVLVNALGERPDGKWAATEVGVEVPRQNGKGGILEGRELTGLFILGERLIIHSAHEFATALEAFRRLLELIESTPDFDRRVKRVSRAHGEEGVELKGGQRIRFKTRTKGGGRGFSADCLILDEAMVIPEAMYGATLPTLAARPNPQVWLTGSAVDQEIMEHGRVFARTRARALKGDDPALAYFGWSPPVDHPDELTPEMACDPEVWAQANPGLGIRITSGHIQMEQRSMDPRTFAVERLGVGDWPSPDGTAQRVIDMDVWASRLDARSQVAGTVCFAFDVSPDRGWSSIGVSGLRSDGLDHVEVVERRRGTDWVVDRLVELKAAHSPGAIVCDQKSPAMSLVKALSNAGVEVRTTSTAEYTQACGAFYDAVDQGTVRHIGADVLTVAIKGAAKRQVGDVWAWSRTASGVDITPVVVSTLALWASKTLDERSPYESKELLIL